jgi:intracellular sulfur oxidation DsrE/DsrF family protein
MMRLILIFSLFCCSLNALGAMPANMEKDGYIKGYGPFVPVQEDWPVSRDTQFRVVFDLAKAAAPGEINKTILSAARFINMHVDAGFAPDKINVVVVVHGSGGDDVGNDEYYEDKTMHKNANAPLVKALADKGVQFIVCGQSAAFYGMAKTDFLPEVKMALSAMTAHAVLQQSGYTLNPF